MSRVECVMRAAVVCLLGSVMAAPGSAEEPPPVEENQSDAVSAPAAEEANTIPPDPVDVPVQAAPETLPLEAPAEARSLMPDNEAATMSKRPADTANIHFKPGTGLVITSADGDFSLKTRVRLQFLYTIVKNDGEEARHDLRMRRVRFIFAGNLFGKHNKYKFEVDALASTPVLDFYFDFERNKNASVRVGQWKIASNRQRVISSGDLQLVDRSIVNAEFTLDRDIGIDLRSKDFLGKGKMRYYLNVTMGQGRNNPRFEDDFGLVYLARFEYLPMGMFVDYKNTDFERSKRARLSLGWAYAFSHNAPRNRGNLGGFFPDGGTANFHHAYFDAIFKVVGFSAFTEVMLRSGSRNVGSITMDDEGNPITPPTARDGVGWTMQAGYLIPKQPFEIAGRYSGIWGISNNTSLEDNHELAMGLSWYFGRHAFKIQADVTHFWTDEFGNGGDVRGRVQLQGSL